MFVSNGSSVFSAKQLTKRLFFLPLLGQLTGMTEKMSQITHWHAMC
jgi:hypothetical protein